MRSALVVEGVFKIRRSSVRNEAGLSLGAAYRQAWARPPGQRRPFPHASQTWYIALNCRAPGSSATTDLVIDSSFNSARGELDYKSVISKWELHLTRLSILVHHLVSCYAFNAHFAPYARYFYVPCNNVPASLSNRKLLRFNSKSTSSQHHHDAFSPLPSPSSAK